VSDERRDDSSPTPLTVTVDRQPTLQELPNLSEARSDGDIPPATYEFRLYSGKMLKLFAEDLYELDGKTCKGAYTGDDFCDVSVGDIDYTPVSSTPYPCSCLGHTC